MILLVLAPQFCCLTFRRIFFERPPSHAFAIFRKTHNLCSRDSCFLRFVCVDRILLSEPPYAQLLSEEKVFVLFDSAGPPFEVQHFLSSSPSVFYPAAATDPLGFSPHKSPKAPPSCAFSYFWPGLHPVLLSTQTQNPPCMCSFFSGSATPLPIFFLL